MTILRKKAATAVSIAFVAVLGGVCGAVWALAADSPWVGSWSLDRSKSDFTGDTMTYSKSSNGMYHFSDGSITSFDFGLDGKEYPSSPGETVTWTPAGDHSWDSVDKAKGGFTVKIHRELSAGDKTLTITATGTKPDGTTFNEESVYTRVTGKMGLIGKWRSIKSSAGAPEKFVVSSPSQGILHWEIPDFKETVEGKMDGTDLPISGPTVPPGMTFSGKFVSPTRLSYVLKISGKPMWYGDQTIAADRKSFTDVSYAAGKKNEKSTGFYAKQ